MITAPIIHIIILASIMLRQTPTNPIDCTVMITIAIIHIWLIIIIVPIKIASLIITMTKIILSR